MALSGPPQETKTRRYRSATLTPAVPTPEVAPNNEIAFGVTNPGEYNPYSTWDDLAASSDPVLSTAGKGIGAFKRFSDQLQSNMAAGILQIPTDVVGMADLVRVGTGSLIGSIPEDPANPKAGYVDRLKKNFVDGMLPPEGQKELADDMIAKVGELRTAMPNASDEQVDAFLQQYQDSPEYFDLLTSKLSPGFRLAQYGNKWANEFAGLGKRPDQQTSVDDIEQIFGQSIIGLPSATVKALGGVARKVVGDRVMDSLAAKAVTKALEVATPVTLPLTPGNVAANTIIGAGIGEAMRAVNNQPGFIRGHIADFTPQEVEQTPELATITPEQGAMLPAVEAGEAADGHGTDVDKQVDNATLLGGVTLGSFFALPVFRRAATVAAQNSAKRAIDQIGLNGGPTLAEQSSRLKPILNPTSGITDTQAPIIKGANQFELYPQYKGQVTKGEMLDAMDAHMSTASPPNAHDAVVNLINFGNIANSPDTIPLHTIRRAATALPPNKLDLLSKYGIAMQRRQDASIRSATLDQEMRKASMDYQAAVSRNDTRAANMAQKRYNDLAKQQQNLSNDTEDSRNIMQKWSKSEVDEIINAAEADPDIMAVANMQRKSGHDMLNYAVKNGYITSEEATIQAANRDFYFPVRERSHPGVHNPGLRRVLLFADRVAGRGTKDRDYHPIDAVRNLDERATNKVNQPKDPIVALQEAWSDVIQAVTANNARRQVVDTLRMFDGAEGKMFEQFEHNGRKSFTAAEYYNPASGLRDAVEHSKVPLTRVIRNGNFEFYKFSDPGMSHALEYAPLAVVPIMNGARKMFQTAVTGVFAPWFAVKSAYWDTAVARASMKSSRSLGLMDTYARRLFNESTAVNRFMDNVPDPTAALSVLGAMPYAASMRAARAVGQKIADDLMTNSGIFNMIAKVPGGRKYVEDMGTWMTKAFDRSVFNVYNRNLSTSMGLLQENAKVLDDYNLQNTRINALGEAARNSWRGYKALVESVQGATRMAFFFENYTRLQAKHGGTVPKGELLKLVKETKDLTGDMSKYSNNKLVQYTASVFPYVNPTIQGTKHILSVAMPTPIAKGINAITRGKANLREDGTNRFWPQFISGMVLPAIASSAILATWPGAEDYWNNKVPEWRRLTGIPIPSADAVATMLETGQWPEFNPDNLTVLEIAPEMSLLLNPVMAGLRALGVVGTPATMIPKGPFDDIAAAAKQAFSFATPPYVKAGLRTMGINLDLSSGEAYEVDDNTFGGANADMRTANSDMSKTLYDVIGALVGSAGQLAAQTFDVGQMTFNKTHDLGRALDQAFETFKYEAGRRFPDVPGLFNTPTKQYASTPEAEYVFKTEQQLQPIFNQHPIEIDSQGRVPRIEADALDAPNHISDPLLKGLADVVYDSMRKKGPYKAASEEYTNIRAELNALEASRGRWTTEAYHAKYNELVKQQQLLRQIQAQVLTNQLEQLQKALGPAFEQHYGVPFNYETLSTLVRKDVGGN